MLTVIKPPLIEEFPFTNSASTLSSHNIEQSFCSSPKLYLEKRAP